MLEVRDGATVTTTWENSGETRRSSLKTVAAAKQVGNSSRRPLWLPGLPTKVRKLTIHPGSLQLDDRILEKCCRGLMSHDELWVNFCCNIWLVDSEFGVNNMKASLHPGWIDSSGWCRWNGVCLGGDFLGRVVLTPQSIVRNYCYWSCPSYFCSVTKCQSSQSVFTLARFQPSKWTQTYDSASFAHMQSVQ